MFVAGRFSFHDTQVFNFGEVINKRVKGYGVLQQSTVFSMEEHENVLYFSGGFIPEQFGTETWTTLVTFDGETLKPHYYQTNGVPRKLISYNGYLYVVGHFTEFNGEPAFGVVRMNQFGYEILNTDSIFSPSGYPTHNQGNMINDAIILNDTLYITGQIGRIGPYENLNCVAKLNMALSAPPTPLPVAGVNLYPNPSLGDAFLEAPEFFTTDAIVRIFSINGKMIRIERWPAYTRRKRLERGDLAKGVCLVELIADSQRNTLRWVIME